MAVCQCSEPIWKHLLMEQMLFFLPLCMCIGEGQWRCERHSRWDNMTFVPMGGHALRGSCGTHCTGPSAVLHFLWWLIHRRRRDYPVLTFSQSLLVCSKPQASLMSHTCTQRWSHACKLHTYVNILVCAHRHRSPDMSTSSRILDSLRFTLWTGLVNKCAHVHACMLAMHTYKCAQTHSGLPTEEPAPLLHTICSPNISTQSRMPGATQQNECKRNRGPSHKSEETGGWVKWNRNDEQMGWERNTQRHRKRHFK